MREVKFKGYFMLLIFHSYDGDAFHQHSNSKNGHYTTTLANMEGSPLAVSGRSGSTWHNKSETYDISTDTWTEVAEYPYHPL